MKQFILRQPVHFQNCVAFLANVWEAASKDGKPIAVTIAPEKTKRNLQQNRYYHALLKQIEEQAWVEGRQYSAEVWHEMAKRKFIGFIDLPGGGCIGQSTTSLSVGEFAEFTSQVEAWASQELGVYFVEAA